MVEKVQIELEDEDFEDEMVVRKTNHWNRHSWRGRGGWRGKNGGRRGWFEEESRLAAQEQAKAAQLEAVEEEEDEVQRKVRRWVLA